MLGSGLVQAGVEVAVTAVLLDPSAPEPPSIAALRKAGAGVFTLATPSRKYLAESRAHRSLIERWKPDVVHSHGYRADILGGLATGNRAVRVSTAHGFAGGDWKNRLYEYLQTRSFRSGDAVIAVSKPLGERLIQSGIAPAQVHVIPNAWAPLEPMQRTIARRQLGLAEQEIVLGWVGRFSHEKGLDVLVDALPALTNLGFTVSVIGDGAAGDGLRDRARQLGVADRIRWHGLIPDAARLYSAFDGFVLSSRTEGTPMALFEAISAGVPVIATRVGGVPDVVGPDEALLVAPEQPAELAAAIRTALRDSGAAKARAAKAKDRMLREFSASTWIERHLELYHGLLAGPTRGKR